MNQAVDHNQASDIVKQLTGALHRLAKSNRAGADEARTVHRLELNLATLDPLLWLAAQPGEQKFYWRDRNGCRQIACVGAAATFLSDLPDGKAQALGKAAVILRHADPNVRLYGGFRFDPLYPQTNRDPLWKNFGAAWLMLPRFELVTDEHGSRLSCNILGHEIGTSAIDDILSEVEKLHLEPQETDISLPVLVERTDSPERTSTLFPLFFSVINNIGWETFTGSGLQAAAEAYIRHAIISAVSRTHDKKRIPVNVLP